MGGRSRRVGQFRAIVCATVAALTLGGCFSEQSFPMRPDRLVRVPPEALETGGVRIGAREWVEPVHQAAAVRLPDDARAAITTNQLGGGGEGRGADGAGGGIVNVWQRLEIQPATVDSWWNWRGLEQTAEVASAQPDEQDGHLQREPWEGFQDIEVPAGDGATLYGRLGVPEKSAEIPGSYIVITHGLFGSLDGEDMKNHVEALRRAGHHVLAVEMRGHGETACRHPEYAISFGVRESGDLITVARWLKSTHGATRVGLVSFSLTGYEALLTAWLDGREPVREFKGEPLLRPLPDWDPAPAYNGGMLVVSPPVGIVRLADGFEPRLSILESPCRATYQERVEERMASCGEGKGHGLWALARGELARGGLAQAYATPQKALDALVRFLDFSGDDWKDGARRLENVRVPVVVLASANDPLGTAQGVAELFGRVSNPNVGVILLREGGHMGFAALSADYYYSVMLNFFDPRTAPRTIDARANAVAQRK